MDMSDDYSDNSDAQPAKVASAAAAPPKLGKGDAYEYWQKRLGTAGANEDESDDDDDSDEEIEESKDAHPDLFKAESDHYSDEDMEQADDDDFELSQTIKKVPGTGKTERGGSGKSSIEPSPVRPLAANP